MPPKRRSSASVLSKGLQPGETLNRASIASVNSPWGWVGNVVTNAKDITLEHRLSACNLSAKKYLPCTNKHSFQKPDRTKDVVTPATPVAGELEEDVIVISDDEGPSCSKKQCKANPNCLNYLGQQAWEDEEGAAFDAFLKASKLGRDPSQDSRVTDLPVGLKNLGATCYANASLQVWFRDLTFRSGVYSCEPPENATDKKYKDSPIFQLQVTFASLQEGNKRVFNPQKLVESLQLQTSEQQDAQEFSKLFISHLDAEFKKQVSPSIKTLITDQFQGMLAYGTICHGCKNRSERPSDFLELEISFNSNCDLEERLEASLLPEQLTGENRYFCSRCDSLQEATRYTELRQLPPVLHFSLLRFVYDTRTMERKKSKHSVSFPPVLNMQKYMGSKNDRKNPQNQNTEDDVYELRGVLMHKGASAYHGHYEAQVNDAETGSWFQFNDDEVTRIDNLGDSSKKSINSASTEKKPTPSQLRKDRTNAHKRRKIDDSDGEVVEITEPVSLQPTEKSRGAITSRDAYMLIYAKRGCHGNLGSTSNGVASGVPTSYPIPPSKVMDVIRDSNKIQDDACLSYKARKDNVNSQFQELRRKVRHIYSNWAPTSYAESAIVSKQALEAWLSEHCIAAGIGQQNADDPLNSAELRDNRQLIKIPLSDIICEHGALDPEKAKDMKRISIDTVAEILTETHCSFEPALKPSDVCSECITSLFNEKLYEIEHPKLTKKLEDTYMCQEGQRGYWISKKWLKDFKLNKPRMHRHSEPDPCPDSSEYHSHVICEHGGLSLNAMTRRKISAEAVKLLQKPFPDWRPLSSDAEPCAICDAQVHISKEDKKENRRRVEDEKALLKFIYEPSLEFWTSASADKMACAIIPAEFVKKWNRWIASPSEANPRPQNVDNTPLICQHQLLTFDPNSSDMNSTMVVIQREQWDVLESLYPGGPCIPLTKRKAEDGSTVYDHDTPICAECRLKRNIEWEMTRLTIRLCRGDKMNDTDTQSKPVTYARKDGARQSKRLRSNKQRDEQRLIMVTKFTTVKDIKVMINEEFSIPTIQQRLFYKGEELEDNTATASSIGLFADDVMELREVQEVFDICGSDSDEKRPVKRRREEAGFRGTLLGNVDSSFPSSPEPAPPSSSLAEDKPCLACTFSNSLDALACEMCETPFL